MTKPLPRSARPFDRDALATADAWGAGRCGVALLDRDGLVAERGSRDAALPWASVTKLVSAYTVLVLVERGDLSLEEPAGPPGATVRHLLAHASGYAFDDPTVVSPPERTRIYSNTGFDVLAAFVEARTGAPFATLVRELVLGPLGMAGATPGDRASQGLTGTLRDMEALAWELLAPSLVGERLVREATAPVYPALRGILPGFGLQDPCPWGLGFEIRGSKSPHWTGPRSSPSAFGHFGGSGTFLWVDPVLGLALVALTDRTFGQWAIEAWPRFSDAVIEAATR